MEEKERAQLKALAEKTVSALNGEAIRFYADKTCRQKISTSVFPSPAFEVDDNFKPTLRAAECQSIGTVPGGGEIAFAKIKGAGGIPVEKYSGQQLPGVIYVCDTNIRGDGCDEVEIVYYEIAVQLNATGAPNITPPGFEAKAMGVVNIIRKADKDAAFAAARLTLPQIVTDDMIREYTEHGRPISEMTITDCTADAAEIPDADPWLDPEQAETPGA